MALLYVSTTGSDTNSGTSTNPVKTISKAAQLAQPGDTVLVHGGVYNGLVRINKNGAAGAPITFKPMDGEKVVIDGAGTPARTDLVVIGGDYVTFQGFEVKNATMAGIVGYDAHDLKIVGNKIHDTYRHATFTYGTTGTNNSYNNVIEGNEVWNSNLVNVNRTSTSGWGQAISVLRTDNAVIKNNYVHDNWGEGIDVIASKGATVTGNVIRDSYSVQLYLDNAQDATVQNNTIYHTYKTEFYRFNKPAQGIQIANEDGYGRYLPSSNIKVTDNVMGGVGEPVYLGYGAGGGLQGSVIAPNTIHNTPDPVIAANPNPGPSIPGSAPTPAPVEPVPTPTPVEPPAVKGLTLHGTAAADNLKGGSLDDALSGAGGSDLLFGFGGNDTLTGGAGADGFVFTKPTTGGVDRITDFNPVDDIIVFDVEFTAMTNRQLLDSELRLGTKALDRNDYVIYDKATGSLFYDADATGAGAQVKIAVITPGTTLTRWDFWVNRC